jgi:hypothetical protein
MADERDELAPVDLQIDVVQGPEHASRGGKVHRESGQFELGLGQ